MEPIIARLTYAGAKQPSCEAEGISITARTPILALCRKLDEAGHGDRPLTVVNAVTGSALMEITSIADGAKLSVDENGPRFQKYTPFEKSFLSDNG